MLAKKGFSLLEVTVSMLVLGLTVTALTDVLGWSNIKYKSINSSLKERSCLTEARAWLRQQILENNQDNITLELINKELKCPEGFAYSELKLTKHDEATYFVKLSVYEDKNRNGKAEDDEGKSRLFCFRKRSA